MNTKIITMERAFQLAEASVCTNLTDIKKRLTAEGIISKPPGAVRIATGEEAEEFPG